jgi:low affinity Fe/Cu permease|tara:strand:- start:199 stop:456 length:258 start_codon:yes stop_codon:yes gene_type:complete
MEHMNQSSERKSWNWNTILRWIHLLFASMISIYFARITIFGETWSDEVTMFVGQIVMMVVFWTGIIKWQLPRIKKWNRNRKVNTA